MSDTSSNRHACVIGATGFIGRSSVAILQENGFHVKATMRNATKQIKRSKSVSDSSILPLPAELLLPGVDVVKADVTDLESIRSAIEGCEVGGELRRYVVFISGVLY